jgi:hypothetical protein
MVRWPPGAFAANDRGRDDDNAMKTVENAA